MAKIRLLEIGIGYRQWSWEVSGKPYRDGRVTLAECRCECGAVHVVNLYNLVHGVSKSCGCAWRLKVEAGSIYGRWTVIGEPFKSVARKLVRCRCECGNENDVVLASLLKGGTQSCGCLRVERATVKSTSHGDSRGGKRARLYGIWTAMWARCTYPSLGKVFQNYGGRGIRVCEEWRDYPAFKAWALQSGYGGGLSIERLDVNGNYEPGNCTWIARTRQARNRRDTRYLTAFGETKGIRDWPEDPRCPVAFQTIKWRLKHGWSEEDAISKPPKH